MKKRFNDDQIIGAVKKLEVGTPAKERPCEMGVTTRTFYRWKKRFGGMDIANVFGKLRNYLFITLCQRLVFKLTSGEFFINP